MKVPSADELLKFKTRLCNIRNGYVIVCLAVSAAGACDTVIGYTIPMWVLFAVLLFCAANVMVVSVWLLDHEVLTGSACDQVRELCLKSSQAKSYVDEVVAMRRELVYHELDLLRHLCAEDEEKAAKQHLYKV